MTSKKIILLDRPRSVGRWAAHNAHPRIRISIDDHKLREDFYSHKRKTINKIRKEVLPVVYSMLKFDNVHISSKDTKAWYSSENGGGAYSEGFVIYDAPAKYMGHIYLIHLGYEGYETKEEEI